MADNELQIEITKPEGVELSPEMTAALENLAETMASEADDEVSGFAFDKMEGAFGNLGGGALGRQSEQWKICWGGYAKGETGSGSDACSGLYFNSKD